MTRSRLWHIHYTSFHWDPFELWKKNMEFWKYLVKVYILSTQDSKGAHHYSTASLKKDWTQVLCGFKSWLGIMVPAGKKGFCWLCIPQLQFICSSKQTFSQKYVNDKINFSRYGCKKVNMIISICYQLLIVKKKAIR